MDEMTGIIFAIFSLIIPITIIGVVVYFIVSLLRKKEERIKITTKHLFQVYLYIISFVTLIVALIGGSTAIKAGLAYPVGMEFSYTLYSANNSDDYGFEEDECYDGEPVNIKDGRYCVNYSERTGDLINGITIFTSMIILFLIHQIAIKKIEKEDKITWLPKIYNFASLILYSIISIIAIPVSIYQFVSFLVLETSDTWSTLQAPAMALSVALLATPLWIFFLIKNSKIKESI